MAQTDTLSKRHSILVEGLGIGGYWSVNYQWLKSISPDLYLTGGLSVLRMNNFEGAFDPSITIPTSVGYLIGPGPSKLDLALSNTFVAEVLSSETFEPKRRYQLNGALLIGYRYIEEKGNWFFRIYYAATMVDYVSADNSHFENWGGAGIGYSFK